MKYKLTIIGLCLIPTIIFMQSPNVSARGEHGGEGGGAAEAPTARAAAPAAPTRMAAPPPQQRSFAPPPQRAYAPPPQQRSFAPPPQRAYAPPPQQKSFAPQQQQRSFTQERSLAPQQQQRSFTQERSFAPQQQQRSFAQERSFAPQQQQQRSQRAERSFSQASRQDASSHNNGDFGSRNVSGNNLFSPQAMSGRGQNSNIGRNSQGRNELGNDFEKGANNHMGLQNAAQVASMAGSRAGRGSVQGPHAFANPRYVTPLSAGMSPRFSANRPGRLSYRGGAGNIPRAGRKGFGRQGFLDPGGYVRNPRNGTAGFDRNYMRMQLSSLPYFNRNFNDNNRLRNSNYSQWPGGWNPGSYGGNIGYYPGYSWNGNNYPNSYYGMEGYTPTPWLFDLSSGSFWQPGAGYADALPYGYNQPITITVDEVVPSFDSYGNVLGYQTERFYYDAVWDSNEQAYGYYDYRGQFHWTTFPWLNTWSSG